MKKLLIVLFFMVSFLTLFLFAGKAFGKTADTLDANLNWIKNFQILNETHLIKKGTRIGLNYTYGRRWDKNGTAGQANRILTLFYYDF
jgi:hypothetical protein